ncbi:MAG: hypothetical protein CMN75_11965 [Spirochaeta sp.]|nr:hypothetical protein [Spirochaeta sp.]
MVLVLAMLLTGNAWCQEQEEKKALQAELDGDKAFLIEWLGQPDDDTRLDEMHEEPEIQAIAERMPRTQARLRELEAKPGSTETEAKPKD